MAELTINLDEIAKAIVDELEARNASIAAEMTRAAERVKDAELRASIADTKLSTAESKLSAAREKLAALLSAGEFEPGETVYTTDAIHFLDYGRVKLGAGAELTISTNAGENVPDGEGDVWVNVVFNTGGELREGSHTFAPADKLTRDKPVEEPTFKVGDRVRILDNGGVRGLRHFLEVGSYATVSDAEQAPYRGETYIHLFGKNEGGAERDQCVPLGSFELAPARVFRFGDPEPEDRETIALTGEDKHGNKVLLKWGKHSETMTDGGTESWWSVKPGAYAVSTGASSYAPWPYWMDRFGPLTEQI